MKVFEVRLTHTSESLRPVAVPDPDHQREEVDLAEPADGPLHQAAATAAAAAPGADGAAAQRPDRQPAVSVTHEPLWPGQPTLQLVLTAALQHQGQTLVA